MDSRISLCALCLSLQMFHFVLYAVLFTCFALCFVPFCSHILLCALCRCVHMFCFVLYAVVFICFALCRCVHVFCFVLYAVVSTCFALCFMPLCSHVLLYSLCRCFHMFCLLCFMPLCSHVLLCLPYLLLWRGQHKSLVGCTLLSQCDLFVKQTRRCNPTYEIYSTHIRKESP